MKKIESLDNPLVKRIISLKRKKFREKYGEFYIEGLRMLNDAIDNGKEIKNILIMEEKVEDFIRDKEPEIVDKIVVLKDELFKKILDTETPQGYMAIIEKTDHLVESFSEFSRILVLDGISDPGNMGTIMRTALAGKIELVVLLKGCVDIYNPKVVRSTMGAIMSMPYIEVEDMENFFNDLKQSGFEVLAADLGGEKDIYSDDFSEKTALILGSEAFGPVNSRQYADYKITIPMDEKAESLNVSVAAGILIYAINKRNF